MVSRADWHADRRRLARRLHGFQRHPLRIFSGSANKPLAEEVAACLGVAVGRLRTTRLPDSEVHVQVEELVRGHDIFLIQPCSTPVNDPLMELLLSIDPFGARQPTASPQLSRTFPMPTRSEWPGVGKRSAPVSWPMHSKVLEWNG